MVAADAAATGKAAFFSRFFSVSTQHPRACPGPAMSLRPKPRIDPPSRADLVVVSPGRRIPHL